MASDESFVKFVADQMAGGGKIRYRKMFGEYAIYCNEKVVALVCDNKLFVKPTAKGRSHTGEITKAPPYPGAKPYFQIGDKVEDREWLGKLVEITVNALS